jgi:hypothetical protein
MTHLLFRRRQASHGLSFLVLTFGKSPSIRLLILVDFGLGLSFPEVSVLERLAFGTIGMGAVRGIGMGVDMASELAEAAKPEIRVRPPRSVWQAWEHPCAQRCRPLVLRHKGLQIFFRRGWRQSLPRTISERCHQIRIGHLLVNPRLQQGSDKTSDRLNTTPLSTKSQGAESTKLIGFPMRRKRPSTKDRYQSP